MFAYANEFITSNLLNGNSYVLSVDVPLLRVGESSTNCKLCAESLGLDLLCVAGGDLFNNSVTGEGNLDVVHNLKAGILTHGLDLGDNLADVTLLDELGSEILVDTRLLINQIYGR